MCIFIFFNKNKQWHNSNDTHNFSLTVHKIPGLFPDQINSLTFSRHSATFQVSGKMVLRLSYSSEWHSKCVVSLDWVLFLCVQFLKLLKRFLCCNLIAVWYGLNHVFVPVKWLARKSFSKMTSNVLTRLLNTTSVLTLPYKWSSPYSIISVRHGADPGFLAVSPQVTLVINLVVGCRYFPPGPRLLSQPKRPPPWPVPNYTAWWQRHTGVSSFPKATMQ